MSPETIKNRERKIPETGTINTQNIKNIVPSEWKNPGAGIVPVYQTEDGTKVVRGKRFDDKWKLSVGGAVEKGENLEQAGRREQQEETFSLLPSKSLADKAHMNNYRVAAPDTKKPLPNGYGHVLKVKGFDYATMASKNDIKSKDLQTAVTKMSEHATNALGGLKALTDKKVSPEERQQLAQKTLDDKHLTSLLSNLGEDGKALLDLLDNVAKGNEFTPIHQFKDNRSKALMTFTEYSAYEIVDLGTAINDLKSGTTKNGSKTFEHEKDAALAVLSQFDQAEKS